MRLLVCGEGTSEIGRPEQEGVIETLVRRCLETDVRRLKFEVMQVLQLPKDRTRAGEARKASQAAGEARRRACDGFIYVRDADGLPSLDHLVRDPSWTTDASGHHEDAGVEYTIELLKRA